MITEIEIQGGEDPYATTTNVPNYDNEFTNAKLYLQTASQNTGDNLYDHLTEVLNKILAERPTDVVDFFEEYSRRIKERRYRPMTDHLEDIYVVPARYELSNNMMPMFKPLPPTEPSTVDPAEVQRPDMTRNNMLELLFYLEQCGVGLPRTDMFFIMLSIRQLAQSEPLASIRFWGKIFGTLNDYIVLECELKEEEHIKRNETYEEHVEVPSPPTDAHVGEGDILKRIAREQQMPGEGGDTKFPRPLPPLPQVQHQEPPEPPSEPSGVGVNKKVYYVCNGVGKLWIQLPDVTPKQIRVARQVYRCFTGNLEESVCTYPEFPGKEKELLRAQIARISSGTQISPAGYFTFGGAEQGEGDDDDEDEEPEEGAGGVSKTTYRVNPKYDPHPLKDLLDGSLSFWVHHAQYILPQGRTSWWNPTPVPDAGDEEVDEELGEEEEDDDDRRTKPKAERAEPETGPPLLTPLSEDASADAIPPWSVRCTSSFMDNYALALVRSNLWPGAVCFSTQGKLWDNVYFGYGTKFLSNNYSPLPLPPVQQEYPIGPEVLEMLDPTGAEEEKWRIDHLPKPKEVLPEGEEVEGEEQEEEEEEKDED